MDSQIKEDWEVALNILKPSKKELEKGIKFIKKRLSGILMDLLPFLQLMEILLKPL